MGRMTKPGAAAKRSGKMQIAWPSAWKVGPPIGVRPGSVHSAHDRRDVLEPVVIRYRYRRLRRYFRGDAAFALPDIHEFPEADGYTYATRLKANGPLQARSEEHTSELQSLMSTSY